MSEDRKNIIEVKHLFNGGQSGIEIIDVCSHVWLHSA